MFLFSFDFGVALCKNLIYNQSITDKESVVTMNEAELKQTVESNNDLKEIVTRLQKLNTLGLNMDAIIRRLNLPLSKHLFITGNFSKLMAIEL